MPETTRYDLEFTAILMRMSWAVSFSDDALRAEIAKYSKDWVRVRNARVTVSRLLSQLPSH